MYVDLQTESGVGGGWLCEKSDSAPLGHRQSPFISAGNTAPQKDQDRGLMLACDEYDFANFSLRQVIQPKFVVT